MSGAAGGAAAVRGLIVVDGIDGSGKSTFARALLAGLAGAGAPGILVSVDDFRRSLDWGAVPSEAEAYYDAYYDLAACDRVLAAFLAGEPGAALPQFDAVAERPAAPRALDFREARVALLEGVFPLRVSATASALVVYLDASPTEARRRIVERDRRKGRTPDEIARRIDRRYAPGQARYHASHDPRARADVVIDNQHPASARCLRRDLARAPAALRPLLDRLLPPPA